MMVRYEGDILVTLTFTKIIILVKNVINALTGDID